MPFVLAGRGWSGPEGGEVVADDLGVRVVWAQLPLEDVEGASEGVLGAVEVATVLE